MAGVKPIFAVGDPVELKSGSPKMTIDAFLGGNTQDIRINDIAQFNGRVLCVWFDESKTACQKAFHQDALKASS